jgi:arylsulfatase A
MALSLLDDAVSTIYTALDDKGISDNTYIIFASDNGGCYSAGGKNGPLRGTKGSLFEGDESAEFLS